MAEVVTAMPLQDRPAELADLPEAAIREYLDLAWVHLVLQWNSLLAPTQTGPASANMRVHWVRAVQLLDQSGHGRSPPPGGLDSSLDVRLVLDGARLNGRLVNQYFLSPHSPCFLLGGLAEFVGLDVTALSAFAGRRPPNLCEEEDRRARGDNDQKNSCAASHVRSFCWS